MVQCDRLLDRMCDSLTIQFSIDCHEVQETLLKTQSYQLSVNKAETSYRDHHIEQASLSSKNRNYFKNNGFLLSVMDYGIIVCRGASERILIRQCLVLMCKICNCSLFLSLSLNIFRLSYSCKWWSGSRCAS